MSMWIDLLRTLDPAEALMRRERKMTDIEILAALSRLKVQTGSLACLGCGYEHNCGVHGCAIMRETAGLIERRAEELAKLRSAREWIPVEERLPENEKDVLILFERAGLRGNVYRVVGKAFHTDGKTNTENSAYAWETDYIDMECDEDSDAYIIPEGWWESVEFGETFSAVDRPVLAWMPLPDGPEVTHE